MSHPDVKTNFYIEAAQDLANRGYILKDMSSVEEVALNLKKFHESGIEYGRATRLPEETPRPHHGPGCSYMKGNGPCDCVPQETKPHPSNCVQSKCPECKSPSVFNGDCMNPMCEKFSNHECGPAEHVHQWRTEETIPFCSECGERKSGGGRNE